MRPGQPPFTDITAHPGLRHSICTNAAVFKRSQLYMATVANKPCLGGGGGGGGVSSIGNNVCDYVAWEQLFSSDQGAGFRELQMAG